MHLRPQGRTRKLLWVLPLAFVLNAMAQTTPETQSTNCDVSWDTIKHKFVGGPYAGAGGMAVGGGSVGVEAFADDAEAIKAIRSESHD